MVFESLGESALKVGAVVGALSVAPPLFLDDRGQSTLRLLNTGLAVSLSLALVAFAFLRAGGRAAKPSARVRYSAITFAFFVAGAGLFILEYRKL